MLLSELSRDLPHWYIPIGCKHVSNYVFMGNNVVIIFVIYRTRNDMTTIKL